MQSTYELIINDDAGMTTMVPLGQAEVSIGRQPGNSIQLTERNVSRYHARLVCAGSELGIEDLGSYTGVRVNGQRIAGKAPLTDGDRVQIGDYQLALRRVAVTMGMAVLAGGRDIPAAPDRERRPSAARPARSLGSAAGVLLGAALGMGMIALLGGIVGSRQAAAPGIPQRAALPVRAVPAVGSQIVGGPTTAPPPIRERTASRDAAPSPSPPGLVTLHRRHSAPSHRETLATPATSGRPASADPLTPEQAADLLAAAQVHYVNGEFAEAIRIARRLQTREGVAMTRAWRILGAAACKLGDLELCNDAYRHVDPVSRQYMLYVCQQSGLTLSAGRLIPAH